jgi:hypothetical protein
MIDTPATAIVTQLLRATDDGDWTRALELLGEQSVTRNSAGRIYVGHSGFENWVRDTAIETTSRHFATAKVRELGNGYVLVVGAEHRDPVRGSAEAIPGAWIYLVGGDRVSACMYFRTERDALASVTGPGRDESPVDVLERCADAFNRDDYDAMISLVDGRVRFRPLLIDGATTEEGLTAFTEALVALRVRYDDILVERIDVDEIGDGYAIATTAFLAVDDDVVARHNLAHAVRVIDGRIAEWLPFERVEAARIAVASHLATLG